MRGGPGRLDAARVDRRRAKGEGTPNQPTILAQTTRDDNDSIVSGGRRGNTASPFLDRCLALRPARMGLAENDTARVIPGGVAGRLGVETSNNNA